MIKISSIKKIKTDLATIERDKSFHILYVNSGTSEPLFFWSIKCPDDTVIEGYNSSKSIAMETVSKILKSMYPNSYFDSEEENENI